MSKDLNLARISENLTPKERVLLVVHNYMEKQKTGKAVLSEADEHTLIESWRPKDNYEVDEYNRFNKGWRTIGFAELDAQTTFFDMQTTFFQEKQISNLLILYPAFKEAKKWFGRLNVIRLVNINQALETVKKQREVKLKNGLDYGRAIYQLTFESLSKDLQNDLLTLYPDVKYETDYLDEEELIANHFSDKEKLADLIVKKVYNQYAKEYQFWHYFASIPLKEIAKRWINKRSIPLEILPKNDRFKKVFAEVSKDKNLTPEEALLDYTAENIFNYINDYAEAHQTTVEDELKTICLEWLDCGMLNEYIPLFISKDIIYKEWIKSKSVAKNTLDDLILAGELSKSGNIITGDSLYSFKKNYQFIREHNEYVDRYDPNLGILYADDDPDQKGKHLDRELLITNLKEDGKPSAINFSQIAMSRIRSYFDSMSFIKEIEIDGEKIIQFEDEHFNELIKTTTKDLARNYSILLGFRELFEKLSKIYEVDLTLKINNWIKEADKFIDRHNKVFELGDARFKDNLFIDTTEITSNEEILVDYKKEFEELFEDNHVK